MDKQKAKDIIQVTFEKLFDKDRFTIFIKNLLNRVEEAPFSYQGQFIPDAYKGYISSLERIGKFNDGENRIDVLIIKLQKETSLERARTMQRNFVAWYLNGSRGGELKEAALVAFVSPAETDWRFSLVKMDYKFEQTKTGKMKVKEEFTPARRWSFLVGANENSHTAQSRLVNILANDEHSPTLAELEQAFDIETVTKEFFIKYRELFIRTKEELDKIVTQASSLKNEFESKGVDTVNFAKKLLGQIVFLYFLQKKGWFGVGRDAEWGTGSKHFLRELFEKKVTQASSLSSQTNKQDACDTINFFNDILEPLFYEALRIDRSHDDHYYSQFNCKIPFLNGGLFDPIGNNGGYDWIKTDIHLTDNLFSNKNKTKEGDEGDGILDIFDRYNFTVREDEPLEKEVAIDPELLGKAYEKFNAIRPDNFEEYKKALKSGKKGEESKFNKQYGVYYTPREIVHYMCQQSLINYLHTVTQASSLRSINTSHKQDACDTASSLNNHKQDACDTITSMNLLENIYYGIGENVVKRRRNLPHWDQDGKAYFVTFRLYDSIPKEAAENIRQERQKWFERNKITDASEVEKLSRENQIEYYRLFSKRYDELLDNGHGSCVLANSDCKKIVEEALGHFNSTRYYLDKYVVMPNHVHVIIIPKKGWELSTILHSWKSFTANAINKVLNRQGELWMHESFDHIIRSPEQLERIRKYIENNPKVAPGVTQASSLRSTPNHKQDACVTITKEDIETLIHLGEYVSENEEIALIKEQKILEGKQKSSDYKLKLPESIRKNAGLIDQKLAEITVCDPAVGSGAFPVGMMSEIVKARNALSVFVTQASSLRLINTSHKQDACDTASILSNHRQDACDTQRTTYDFKRQCIEKSLYGVDIDPGAVEIAKLRLWLSLVVDEDDIKNIKPLPNLDYKIVCGNSLLGVEKNLFNNHLFSKLEKIKPLYFNETNPTKKQDYKKQIDELISKITNGHKEFDFEIYFSEVFHHKGGFDVVIANPPYIRAEDLGDLKTYLKAVYTVFAPSGDIFSYFYEKSFNILTTHGVFCFINNAFDKTTAGKALRKYIADNYALKKYVDFKSVNVFEGTTTYPIILLASKSEHQETFAYLKVTEDIFRNFNSDRNIVYTLLSISALKQSSWSFDHQGQAELSEKIAKHKKLREVFGKCYYGIKTALNDAFITEKDLGNSKHLKPVFEGKDIKKWLAPAIDKKMIVFENKSTRTYFNGYDEAKAFEAMKAAFPAIMNHLKPFAEAARKRYDKGEYWWELRNCAYYDLFAKPKIIFPNLQNSNKFAYDISRAYLNAPAVFLPTDVKWLLGLLNSKAVWYFLKTICVVRSGGFIEVKPQYFEQIPIPALKDTDKKQLDSLVDQILAAKQKAPDADTSALERQIDQLVYKLYGLTEDEIVIVEGKR